MVEKSNNKVTLPLWSSSPNPSSQTNNEKTIGQILRETIYKIPDLYSPKLSRSSKTRKVWKKPFQRRSLWNHNGCVHAKSLQSCLTPCNPTDCNLPGSSIHGILQARILEWVAMPYSRGSSRPRDWTCISCLLHWQGRFFTTFPAPPGKPKETITKRNIGSQMGCWNRKRTSDKN